MEPITWSSVLIFILSGAGAGIIGNRADAGFVRAWNAGTKSLASRIRQGDRYVNDELKKAVRRSFLRTLQTIASDSLEELTGGMRHLGNYVRNPGIRQDATWLEGHLKEIERQLAQVEKDNTSSAPLESFEEVELLITPDGVLNEALVEEAKQKLLGSVTQNSATPAIYRRIAEESLFARICLFFAYEIKSNSAVRDIFQTQLLAKVNQGLEGQALSLKNIQSALQDLVSSLPHLLSKLDSFTIALQQLGSSQEQNFLEDVWKYGEGLKRLKQASVASAESSQYR